MWLIVSIFLLVAASAILIHNRWHLILDIFLIITAGGAIISGQQNEYHKLNYVPATLLVTFFALLTISTIRLLWNPEFRTIVTGTLPGRRRSTLIASALFIVFFWIAVVISPPIYIFNRTSVKSDLKNIGTALEMYLSAHNQKYPVRLPELTPDYLKVIPDLGRNTPDGVIKYYEKKYGIECHYGYEVNNDIPGYTIHCYSFPNYEEPSKHLMYTSKEGLLE